VTFDLTLWLRKLLTWRITNRIRIYKERKSTIQVTHVKNLAGSLEIRWDLSEMLKEPKKYLHGHLINKEWQVAKSESHWDAGTLVWKFKTVTYMPDYTVQDIKKPGKQDLFWQMIPRFWDQIKRLWDPQFSLTTIHHPLNSIIPSLVSSNRQVLYNLTYLAAVSLESTAVVNLLATARATSEIKGGELPWWKQHNLILTISINLLACYFQCHSVIGYGTHYLFCCK